MKFKALLSLALCIAVATPALSQGRHSVRGYTRKDGTYVAPHMRTNPNSTRTDNWSTRGNVNPYTGREGTKDPYSSSPYNSPRPQSSTDTTSGASPY